MADESTSLLQEIYDESLRLGRRDEPLVVRIGEYLRKQKEGEEKKE